MKTFFYTLILILTLGTTSASAQTVNCSTITSTNVGTCCSGLLGVNNASACKNYSSAQAAFGSTTSPTTTQTNQCKPFPTSSNYQYCCNTMRFANTEGCMAYEASVRGTIGGGVLQPTSPINSTRTYGDISSNTSSSSQTGTQNINQCSSIKFSSLLDILIWVKCVINTVLIPLLFALATVFFLWGVMKFIRASDDTKREEGKKFIIAGLIGLFVMTSLWGIISIFGNIFGTGSTVPMLQTTYLKK